MDIVNAFIFGLPSPPVPVMVNRDGRDGYGNSHHLIQQAVLHAQARKNEKEDVERKAAQLPITINLVKIMRSETDPEKIYKACCRFTAALMQTYTPSITLDMRFPPYALVHNETKNPIVDNAREHLAAMKLYDLEGGDFKEYKRELEDLPYSILLQRYGIRHKYRGDQKTEYVM